MALHRRNLVKLGGALVVALCLALSGPVLVAQSGKVEGLWRGQATFKITTPGGKVIVIDPFLTGNPKTPAEYKDLAKLGKVDLILVTHGHSDHVGTVGRTDGSCDAADLAKRTGAKVFGPAGRIQTMIDLVWLTAEQGEPFGNGGKVQPLAPQTTLTQACATREWLKPKFVIPIHYGTFPVLKGTPQEYMAALGQTTTKVFPINPGDRLEF